MTNLITFTYLTNTIRVIEIDGEPWFVAADACRVLELVGFASYHLKKLDQDEVRVMTKAANPTLPIFVGKAHSASLISESGLYKLIMRSDKPEAKPFQDWVTKVVLPAIRKDGGYILGEEKLKTGEMDEDELVLRAIEVMKRKIERLTKERDALKEEVTFVTVDEWRALKHLYLSHGEKTRLGQHASAEAKRTGTRRELQTRIIHRGTPFEREVRVWVYETSLLDEIARKLGIL